MSEHEPQSPTGDSPAVPERHGHLVSDPGLPAHRPRRTDLDPKAARRAERQVAALFAISALGSLVVLVGYFAVQLDDIDDVSLSTKLIGGGLGVALLSIGIGAIHWAKKLMPDVEVVQERHTLRSGDAERADVAQEFQAGAEGTGFGRRSLIRNSLLGSLGLVAVAPLVMLRDLGPMPGTTLRHTMWRKGMRIVNDVTGKPIKATDIVVGQLVNAAPEGIEEVEHSLNERGKSSVVLVRMAPEDIHSQQGENWDHEGILCFSKICTHVGCPISLYEQQTHHLLCPCHQSTFDLAEGAKVIFGPAARHLPQLPITVDAEGYLVAQRDFAEPVGPSFWERG